ncbi:class I SAM-dependent methyltransferase [Amylibacter sp.]|nr:class I SAM-dependent methyltransferase [Amylibacter sp.]
MDYNRRSFETSKIRSWYNVSRFNWVAKKLDDYAAKKRIIELGFYDGRILNHIQKENLQYYHGYDANWEGGLLIAKENNEDNDIVFSQCTEANQLNLNEKFNVFISLETLEHMPDDDLKDYLFEIKKFYIYNHFIAFIVPATILNVAH